MKKLTVICIAITVLSMFLCGCAGNDKTAQAVSAQDESVSGNTLGGWEMVPHEAEELPEEAQKAFDKVKGELSDGDYIPVSLLATQVVAGTNYCILCQVDAKDSGSESKWTLVYIYADLQGNAQIMNTYDLYIAQHSQPKE